MHEGVSLVLCNVLNRHVFCVKTRLIDFDANAIACWLKVSFKETRTSAVCKLEQAKRVCPCVTGLRLQAREQAEAMARAPDLPASRSPGRPLPTGPCLATDGRKLIGWSRRGPRESVVVDDSLGELQSGYLCQSQDLLRSSREEHRYGRASPRGATTCTR